ncbi:MAG: hypothetical protein H6709_15365 [Kofleriaceae bacterium]|nr:hypothetical protein [Kofleriaceae bacterium]
MPASVHRLLIATAAALAAAAAPRPARAGAIAVVLVERADVDDDALVDRVEGQVSDLDVTLVRELGEVGAGAGRAELDAARTIAGPHGARVVVWFTGDGDGWLVHVAEPDAARVLVRRVEAHGDLAGSAAAEAVALVVRAAVRAIVRGDPADDAGDASDAGADTSDPTDDADAGDARAGGVLTRVRGGATPRAATTGPRPIAGLGWYGVVAGGDARHQVAQVRVGVATARWQVAIELAVAPAVALPAPGAAVDVTIDVGRAGLGAAAALELVGAGPWRLAAQLGAGGLRFSRITTATGAGLTATAPSATWVPAVTPALRLRRRVVAATWLELGVGADVLARVPEFGVPSADGFVVHTRLWPVQPFVTVGVTVGGG